MYNRIDITYFVSFSGLNWNKSLRDRATMFRISSA